MSFSTDIKNELCEITPSACCLKAEAFGMLIFGRSFNSSDISFMTELESVAARYTANIRELTGVVPVMKCSKAGNFKIRIDSADSRKKILDYFGYTGTEVALRVNFSNFENTDNECCFKAFLRGAFLSCGNITNPEKEYHLEFNVSKARLCGDLLKIIEETGLKAKKLTRGGGYMVYCKEAETIEDYLGTFGANNSFLIMMRTRAMKDVKNQINRRTNFEAANLERSITAGIRQIELINKILEKIKLTDITDDLAELCTVRIENPEASLDELGKMMSPPLSRSAVSRRIKKLEEIAAELKIK